MEPKKPTETPFERFAALTKRLLAVPKKELREDEQEPQQKPDKPSKP
jgi:hypothetical protein